MLGFVSEFLKAMEKYASSMEDIVHSCQLENDRVRELDEFLSYIQIQYCYLGLVDKAVEMVTDASLTMACNFKLARRDITLKQCASNFHEYDRNRLRRSGFMSQDLFSPAILNAVEKKYEKERSPRRQKLDVKLIFHILRIQGNLPFEVISKVSSKNLYNPPAEVIETERNDCQGCVAPAVFSQGMARKQLSSQSWAHSLLGLQDSSMTANQNIKSSHNSKGI